MSGLSYNIRFCGNIGGILLLFFLIFSLNGCSGGGKESIRYQSDVLIESIEGIRDTIEFHIGSPLFLKLGIRTGRACESFNGHPFFFDERGAQVGWGFEEVSDTLMFPDAEASCERYLMLSSEASNLLAEGYYSMSVALLIDEKSELRSDTIVLHPIHASGANALSYSRFILEQIILNSPLLEDRATLRELFSDHLPQSFASDVYRAAIFYRGGDRVEASDALAAAERRMKSDESSSTGSANTSRLFKKLQANLSEEMK
ncbi:MAG: hypothetical protein R3F28_13895 [Candidatus Kapaibacterium sp.]|nr:hypothetical protein [Ignavibacteria bacterium]